MRWREWVSRRYRSSPSRVRFPEAKKTGGRADKLPENGGFNRQRLAEARTIIASSIDPEYKAALVE